jgi:hypothetical protein
MSQVITAAQPGWVGPFTGLSAREFRTLVALVARRGGQAIADGRPGRQWGLPLADRVLLLAVYWRTNLTLRQVAPLFGISRAAAHRVVDSLSDLLALAPATRRRADQVAIVDGTLVPTRDHRLAAPSKNYRYSANIQVAIDADTQLVIAVGDPLPGNRHDSPAFRESGMADALAGQTVVADLGYLGNPGLLLPVKRQHDRQLLPWQHDLNTSHRQVRARVEHTFARMKTWKILRDYRRRAPALKATVQGIATLHNLVLTG